MATSYVRQSSAEIINGQVINDSDFNNEFDRIQGFAHGTTGHDHSGGTGLGPRINLTATTPGVTGVLDSQFGGIHSAAVDPTAANCTPSYVVGSIWINTATSVAFVCIDQTAAAAVWHRLPPGTITGATTIPTTANDVTQGYRVGSVIVNTTQGTAYICKSNTAGSATWDSISVGRVFVATTAPTVNDDSTKGYQAGSVGVETTTPTTYICVSAGAGAAVWQSVTFNAGFAAMLAVVYA